MIHFFYGFKLMWSPCKNRSRCGSCIALLCSFDFFCSCSSKRPKKHVSDSNDLPEMVNLTSALSPALHCAKREQMPCSGAPQPLAGCRISTLWLEDRFHSLVCPPPQPEAGCKMFVFLKFQLAALIEDKNKESAKWSWAEVEANSELKQSWFSWTKPFD